MASPVQRVLNEYAIVKYDLPDGRSLVLPIAEAREHVRALLPTADKADAQFQEIVACRSTVFQKNDDIIGHSLCIWTRREPLSPEVFLNAITYPLGISNEAWREHKDRVIQAMVSGGA
jgi:hypothetical protein